MASHPAQDSAAMNPRRVSHVDSLVIGAGMSGLCAASALKAAGKSVVVVDKARGVGGRMATRRMGGATLDHGAQFVTARTGRFESWIHAACTAGAAAEWCRGFSGARDGHTRWRGLSGMSGLARHLAAGLELRMESQVAAVSRAEAGWEIRLTDGTTLLAESVVLTAPVPQSMALLDAGGVVLETGLRARLEAVRYERCLALLLVLDGPSSIPEPGGFAPGAGPLAWLADNQKKGISALPSVTAHAGDAYSVEHWDRDREEVARELIRLAEPLLGAGVVGHQMHGWRYSRPLATDFSACVVVEREAPLILAGDAFGGARVEGAALSGWAAAAELCGLLSGGGGLEPGA